MPSANKLAFAVTQLHAQVEAEKEKAREEAVSARMAASAAPVVSVSAVAVSGNVPEKTETKAASVGERELTGAESWTTDQVVQWAEKHASSFTAQKMRIAAITGESLLGLKELDAFVESAMDRRRLEYAISKLREPLEAKKMEEEELKARVLEGSFTAGPGQPGAAVKLVEQQRAMGNGVFGHISYSENGFMLEVENTGKTSSAPMPIVVSIEALECTNVELESARRKFWVLPNMEVKLQQGGGSAVVNPAKGNDAHKRFTVVLARAKDLAQAWSVRVRVSYVMAESAEDWVAVDNELKTAAAAEFAVALPNFAELSPPELQLAMEAAKIRRMTDPQFPPTNASLYIDPLTPPPNVIPIQWKRPRDMTSSPVLFSRPPGPQDIQQGRLGSCWFLAALSLLDAKQILRLFETQSLSESGINVMRFYTSGSWKRVMVDDYIPSTPLTGFPPYDLQSLMLMARYKRGTGTHATPGPLYARCSDPDAFWVPLLEKGYAKLNRSFEAISGGSLGESLSALTGAPSISIFLPWEQDKDAVFERMLEAHNAGMLIGCATRQLTLEERLAGVELERNGIVSRHAYGVLAMKRIKTGQRFVRVRNPWGQFVWNGAFSDASTDWTLQLKLALNFKEEPGCWWMLWKDFQQFFHDVSICLIGLTDEWHRLNFSGVYDRDHAYGFQGRLASETETPVLITVAKEDLRYAQGTDSNNRQGIYLLEQLADGKLARVASTGEFARQEVTLEATLKPGKVYFVAVMSQIGSLLFSSVKFDLCVESRDPVVCEAIEPQSELLLKAVVAELQYALLQTDDDRFVNEVHTLQHICFKQSTGADKVSNRIAAGELGCGELLLAGMRKWPKERELQNMAASSLWNMSCAMPVRVHLRNATDALQVLASLRVTFAKDEEMLEVADVAARNIANAENIVAQDPFIEECILANKCTFSVSGSKNFLLQVWYDCITCNLVSNFGVCQTCRDTCHKGHEVSAPKFSRFYCDCGAGKSAKKSSRVVKCISVDTTMRKKREKDLAHYDPDAEEEEEEQERKKKLMQLKKDAGKKKTGVAGMAQLNSH